MTPKGWKLVPEDATPEMLAAGESAASVGIGKCADEEAMPRVWRDMIAASPPPPVEVSEAPIPSKVRGWPKHGDEMRFLDEGGYPRDLLEAREHFTKGQTAIVRDFHLGDWHSTIAFEGIPGHFNSVMFEYADSAALSAIGAKDAD